MLMRSKKYPTFCGLIPALLIAISGLPSGRGAFASLIQSTPVTTYTEGRLELYFRYLQDFKELCARYPLTIGPLALQPLPNDPEVKEFRTTCSKYGEVFRRLQSHLRDKKLVTGAMRKELVDGWGKPMKYSSDGKTFRLEASHGYSVTDQTTAKKNGLHWDNLNPPPDDPPLRIPVTPAKGGANLY